MGWIYSTISLRNEVIKIIKIFVCKNIQKTEGYQMDYIPIIFFVMSLVGGVHSITKFRIYNQSSNSFEKKFASWVFLIFGIFQVLLGLGILIIW
jgi:hypothetical protein